MKQLLSYLLFTLLATAAASPKSIFDFDANDLSGKPVSLSRYKGKKAFLVVNVASKCGLTDQNYQELQQLYSKYSADLEIIAFPCNNFFSQEPGTSEEISDFVATKEVTFPVMEKVDCGQSPTAHPLFPFLCNSLPSTGVWSYLLGNGIKWNFAKFLCDADGYPVKRYGPKQNPLSFEDDIVKLIKGEETPIPSFEL